MINYLTGLGYPADAESLERWWSGASVEHVIGKGILRFHAVYWPAILLSAGLPLPDRIDVHEYLTVDGAKISKSAGGAADPAALVMTYGADALRWWLVRDVARAGDTDFTESRLIARANEDLANTIGNLVGRTTTLARRYAVPESVDGAGIGPAEGSERLRAARQRAPGAIASALDDFDFRRACAAVVDLASEANRYADTTRPWELGSSGRLAAAVAAIGELSAVGRDLGVLLRPFTPALAERIATALAGGAPGGPVFPRVSVRH